MKDAIEVNINNNLLEIIMSKNCYKITKNNLLEIPEKYQRFPFLGMDFLNDYKKNRQEIIDNITEKTVNKIKNVIEISNMMKNISNLDDNINTQNKLNKIFQKIISSRNDETDLITLHKLSTKFELKKKIYSSYSNNFKDSYGIDNNLETYCLLSLCNLIMYEKKNNLKYFNTSLKINDTICSCINNIKNNESLKIILIFILEKEMNHINKICKKKGI